MIDLIKEYLTTKDCEEISGGNKFDCENCEYSDECCRLANRRCNSEYAENVNYGGYDTEEEFWEQLFD